MLASSSAGLKYPTQVSTTASKFKNINKNTDACSPTYSLPTALGPCPNIRAIRRAHLFDVLCRASTPPSSPLVIRAHGFIGTAYAWTHTANAALSGYNNAKASGTVDDCKVACIARANCKSFDYLKAEKSCDLSDSAAGQDGVPALKIDYPGNPYDYYALQRRRGPAELIGDVDTCAQRCLALPNCTAFEVSRSASSEPCHLIAQEDGRAPKSCELVERKGIDHYTLTREARPRCESGSPPLAPPYALRAELPLLKDRDVVLFVGDSITREGCGRVGGWVRLVESGLKAVGLHINRVCNPRDGHTSETLQPYVTSGLAFASHNQGGFFYGTLGDRVPFSGHRKGDRPPWSAKKPHWLVLSAGVNDLWMLMTRSQNRSTCCHGKICFCGVDIERYKVNMRKMVHESLQLGVKVMLLTPTMVGESPQSRENIALRPYVEFVLSLAQTGHVVVADTNAAMHRKLDLSCCERLQCWQLPCCGQLTRRGVHMNMHGNEMMASTVLDAWGLSPAQLAEARRLWHDVTQALRQ